MTSTSQQERPIVCVKAFSLIFLCWVFFFFLLEFFFPWLREVGFFLLHVVAVDGTGRESVETVADKLRASTSGG